MYCLLFVNYFNSVSIYEIPCAQNEAQGATKHHLLYVPTEYVNEIVIKDNQSEKDLIKNGIKM